MDRRGFLRALFATPVVAALAPILQRGPEVNGELLDLEETDFYETTGLVNTHFYITYPAAWTAGEYGRIHFISDLESA